jgi:radical SAM protein with 4Fe4S-binding SPASM domain
MARPKFRRQEPPFCIQLEFALGCNLQCTFCGLNGVQEKPGKGVRLMSKEDGALVANAIASACELNGWNPRLEIARRGEPTINPDYIWLVAKLREHNPRLQIMMTSNGGGLLRKPGPVANIKALFEAGLNILVLDDYKTANIVPKIRDAMVVPDNVHPELMKMGVKCYEYPENPAGNPHRRHSPGTRFISFVKDITDAKTGTHATLNNHAGHGAPLEEGYLKPCVKPFRELGINYDGSIDLCCIDWISEYRLGTLREQSLEDIWQSDAMNAARQYLIKGQRDMLRPCNGCNHPGYRIGLLPDPKGKAALPRPGAWAADTVREVVERGPVERPTRIAQERIFDVLPPWLKDAWRKRIGEQQ